MGRWDDRAPVAASNTSDYGVGQLRRRDRCLRLLCHYYRRKELEELSTSTGFAIDFSDARPLKLQQWKDALNVLIFVLGILERLSRLANLISVDRDDVPTMIAAGIPETEKPGYTLSDVNAVMSRIDLICKLGSPIAISAFMSATNSPRLGAVLLIGLNLLTWPFEYLTS